MKCLVHRACNASDFGPGGAFGQDLYAGTGTSILRIASNGEQWLTLFRAEWLRHQIGQRRDPNQLDRNRLAYLKKLPLDHIKIDQSFVRSVVDDSNDEIIVSTILAMAAAPPMRSTRAAACITRRSESLPMH